MKKKKLGLFIFFLTPLWAWAAFPVGHWAARWTDINTGAWYSSNTICFKSDGTWYFTGPGPGTGNWSVRGSRVLLHGQLDNFNPVLNEAAELSTSNWTTMTGYWQEWRRSDNWNLDVRVHLTFQSATCP